VECDYLRNLEMVRRADIVRNRSGPSFSVVWPRECLGRRQCRIREIRYFHTENIRSYNVGTLKYAKL